MNTLHMAQAVMVALRDGAHNINSQDLITILSLLQDAEKAAKEAL